VKRWRLCLAIAATLAQAGAAAAEEVQVKTTSGVPLRLVVDLPGPEHGAGPFPAVVLAPGQGYHLALPALAQTAQRLAARGVVAYRFDWPYFRATPRVKPSAGLAEELDALQVAVRAARADRRADPARVLVGGKSLGSVVAWRAFAADPQLRGALLLTPLCTRAAEGVAPQPTGLAAYPGSDKEARPVALLLGDQDPLCAIPHVYAWSATAGPAWRVNVVGGDHGFEHKALAAAAADAAHVRSVRAVADLATDFAAEVAAR
jgi:predicted alpha/beta-hydrolase family hydrolase